MHSKIKPSEIDLIVFDLDGTLADSLPDIADAASYACRQLGLPEHPPEAVRDMIGGGERAFARRFLGSEDPRLLGRGLALYLEHYFQHCGDRTRLYPGVKETLPRLADKKLAVLSNKRHSLTELVLQVMGIREFFAALRGAGELPLKPDPAALLAVIRELGAKPARTLMVGDKPADVLAGKAAGTLTAAVTYGYGDPEALIATGPDVIVSHFAELADIVAQ
ncbi:MAG: HAD-IA family hydrolase [Deltaproteobacteria bacterium]|nr:HAD-IA family hydrolase [Deltaproteobacteria bacterium]